MQTKPSAQQRADQTDRSGQFFSDDEILSMDVDAFQKRWDGRFRHAVWLSEEVARRHKEQRARQLTRNQRLTFDRLDHALHALSDAVSDVLYAVWGGGSALQGEVEYIHARRERLLWTLAGDCPRLPGHAPDGARALRIARNALRHSLDRSRVVLESRREFVPPVRTRAVCLRARQARLVLERLVPQVPEGAHAAVAAWLSGVVAVLDERNSDMSPR